MGRKVLSGSDSRSRCGGRAVERIFYLHIIMLVVMTACSVTVWIVMRRSHIETLSLAHYWVNSYRQLILEANIDRHLMQSHMSDDKIVIDSLMSQVITDLAEFEGFYQSIYKGNPLFVPEICRAIQRWIDTVRRIVTDRKTNYQAAVPSELAQVAYDIKDALWTVVRAYNEKMENSMEYRSDVVGMVFLAISTLLVVGLMFLVRAEYLQQQGTIQLAEELASVIHDVRTPQQVIVSAIALISQPEMKAADTVELIQVISDSCSATQRLLDTALLRIRARAAPEPVPLPSIFRTVNNIQGVACRDKGIEWRFDLARSARVTAFFDSDATLQIVNNIVSNAIRYTDRGVVSLSVEIRQPIRRRFSWFQDASTSKHSLVITVADTGRGIPRDSMAVIFQKFQQVKSGSGFGIGLFTVARLTNSANGRIDLWSEPLKGTRFVVTLPIKVVSPLSGDKATMRDTTTPPPLFSVSRSTLPPLNIVLLDDDPITTKLSQRILTTAGHVVRVFSSGADLLQDYGDAEVIVSDVNMPGGMSGMEVAEVLRSLGYQGALIAHTGDTFSHKACLQSGFDAVLPKPSTASTYMEVIESVYRRRAGNARLTRYPSPPRLRTSLHVSPSPSYQTKADPEMAA